MNFFLLITVLKSLGWSFDPVSVSIQSYALIDHMKRIEQLPPVMEGDRIREWILADRLPEGKLYTKRGDFSQEDMERLVENMNLQGIKALHPLTYGWTLRRTNMRMYPSAETIHKGNPRIDYNQYTLLEPFTPLAILHISKDGEWFYVQSPFMRGWVNKRDVHTSTIEQLLKIMQMPFLVVANKGVTLNGVYFGLGSKVRYLEKKDREYKVLLPDGSHMLLEAKEGLAEGYLKFEEERVKSILESLLGTPYDWGGKEGRWDCSSLVQSLYAVFGAELPRNSAQQAKIGKVVGNSFSSYQEFKDFLRGLPPFRTLLFMKGHVMIYGGIEGDDVVIYHSVHRMTKEDGSKWLVESVAKNYLERDGLRNLYKAIVSVNLLD